MPLNLHERLLVFFGRGYGEFDVAGRHWYLSGSLLKDINEPNQ